MSFRRREFEHSPNEFHARPLDASGRELWIPLLPPTPVLVLGSSQDAHHFDRTRAERSGVDIIRRRSGGGAVLVSAVDLVWFDVAITRDDELWVDDVGVAFHWLGKATARALDSLGYKTSMHVGPPRRTRWSTQVCFAGTGHGELSIDERKVVGISQRRTRDAARFQVAILRRWSGEAYAELLDLRHDARHDVALELGALARGIDAAPDQILDAVSEALP